MGIVIMVIILIVIVVIVLINVKIENERRVLFGKALNHMKLKKEELDSLVKVADTSTNVKSRIALEKYNVASFIKDNREYIKLIEKTLEKKSRIKDVVITFLKENPFSNEKQYSYILSQLSKYKSAKIKYVVRVKYITSAGNNLASKDLTFTFDTIKHLKDNPELYMTKTEIKEIEKAKLEGKKKLAYAQVNEIIDSANTLKENIIIKKDSSELDSLIQNLFDRTVNSIQKIKVLDGEEWTLINKIIKNTSSSVKKIKDKNTNLANYYKSNDFKKIKDTCDLLMSSQKDFNEYIQEKINSLSMMFGSRVSRNETIQEDAYNYVRPYKKTISPFTVELSSAVFASAENNPVQYLIKSFYPNKSLYKDQICDLKNLLNELEALRDAKEIINNYKKDYAEYIDNVPSYVLKDDEDGFYSRLGFAVIDENVLNVEYKFVYTSNGGMAQRSFTIPMNEETITELITQLQEKLSAASISKEQRALMTPKIRNLIKERDNYTCCNCGNSSHKEPNLLLEIDHIVPIAKGGLTVEDNLQTLCWKCNRSKGSKLI